jgi:hypothetical protein
VYWQSFFRLARYSVLSLESLKILATDDALNVTWTLFSRIF